MSGYKWLWLSSVLLWGCQLPPDPTIYEGGTIIFRNGQSTTCRRVLQYQGIGIVVCEQADGIAEYEVRDISAIKRTRRIGEGGGLK